DAVGYRQRAARAHQRQPGGRGPRLERAGRDPAGPAVDTAESEERGRAARGPGNQLGAGMTFVQYTPRPGNAQTPSALDFRGLDSLKKGVSGPQGASADQEKPVAQQFEAWFVQQMHRQA